MEAAMNYVCNDVVNLREEFADYTEEEFIALCDSINEGLEDIRQGRYYDFDEVFDELEARF
ncbi:MAG: hypothetical protein NC302_03035 [Bacteroidales bacterium]|nr:hypothetical protein [Bacteroidales bacterium]MCM1414937.1 hypothetical protein [bacterium]MCM1423085.1 hypothetical protein [bacterium]